MAEQIKSSLVRSHKPSRASPVAAVSGTGAVIALLFAGRHSSQHVLTVLLAVWVLSPFIGLWVARRWARGWSARATAVLEAGTLIVSIASLAAYALNAVLPISTKAAFTFVAVPAISWVLAAVAVVAAIVVGRHVRRTRL